MHPSTPSARQGLRLVIASSFVAVAALSRLFPHPPNFTPVGAIALFGGAVFTARVAGYLVPLVAMLLADGLLELRDGSGWHVLAPIVYGCFVATTWLGRRLGARAGTGAIAATSLGAVTMFFLVTNFAVWLQGDLYPRDGAGLLACFIGAVPFLGWSLLAQGVFGLLLFGGHRALVQRLIAVGRLPAVASETR